MCAVHDLFLYLHQRIMLTWWPSEPDIISWTKNMTVLKEVTFQDRAMGAIHKLLPRLYRFTKIPYAQCTLLKKSKNILWEEELKDESTYNVCFQWSQLSGDASSHTDTNTVWGPGSDFYVDTRKIVYFIKKHSTIMQYETSQLLFCAVFCRKYRHYFCFYFLVV